jgi:hypothetical protein
MILSIKNRGMSMDTPAAIFNEAGEIQILRYEISVPASSKMSNKRLTFFNL